MERTVLETPASILATNSETALLFDDQHGFEYALRAAPLITSAEIVRANGTPFARRGSDERGIGARLQQAQNR